MRIGGEGTRCRRADASWLLGHVERCAIPKARVGSRNLGSLSSFLPFNSPSPSPSQDKAESALHHRQDAFQPRRRRQLFECRHCLEKLRLLRLKPSSRDPGQWLQPRGIAEPREWTIENSSKSPSRAKSPSENVYQPQPGASEGHILADARPDPKPSPARHPRRPKVTIPGRTAQQPKH